jgi:hypothetical protein
MWCEIDDINIGDVLAILAWNSRWTYVLVYATRPGSSSDFDYGVVMLESGKSGWINKSILDEFIQRHDIKLKKMKF